MSHLASRYLPYTESMMDIPPGLDGNLVEFVKGGDEFEWQPFSETRFYTNAFVISDDKVGHSVGSVVNFTLPFVLPNSCYSGSRSGDSGPTCTAQHFSVGSGTGADCLPYQVQWVRGKSRAWGNTSPGCCTGTRGKTLPAHDETSDGNFCRKSRVSPRL